MKIKLTIILGLAVLSTLCAARPAEADYDYAEEAPAPPPKKVPGRGALTSRRNPLAAKTNKAATSTTTTTAAPAEEEEPAEGDYEDEAPVETSSTTESSKKFIKSGIVRPFRSNDDLLATLKRRREQAVSTNQYTNTKPQVQEKDEDAPEPAHKESKSAAAAPGGRRGRFNKGKPAASNEPAEESNSTSAPARTGRRFGRR